MKRTRIVRRAALGLAFGVAVLALGGRAAAQHKPVGSLEDGMLVLAERVIKELRPLKDADQEHLIVGVQNFRVKHGKAGAWTENGVVNRQLADRFEVALLLSLARKDNIRVIDQAREAAAKDNREPRPSLADQQGRMRFFDVKGYGLAWDPQPQPLVPDGFITGEVVLDADSPTMTLSLSYFGSNGKELPPWKGDVVRAAPPVLTAAGVSYDYARAVGPSMNAAGVKQRKSRDLLPETPVAIEILYGDEVQAFDAKASQELQVPQPKLTDPVTIRLRLKDPKDKDKYGVVAMINGENSIYPQQTDPVVLIDNYKWVLDKDRPLVTIPGFQESLKDAKGFKVMPWTDALKTRDQLGLFTFVVYRELRAGEKQPEEDKTKLTEPGQAIARMVLAPPGNIKPKSLETLQEQLKARHAAPPPEGATRSVAVLGNGDTLKNAVKEEKFNAYKAQLYSISIRYANLPR